MRDFGRFRNDIDAGVLSLISSRIVCWPAAPPRDPFDRIVAAAARELGTTLITRDRALLAYGEQGRVAVVEC